MEEKILKKRIIEIQLTLPTEDLKAVECTDYSCKVSSLRVFLYIKKTTDEQSERDRIYKELTETAKKIPW